MCRKIQPSALLLLAGLLAPLSPVAAQPAAGDLILTFATGLGTTPSGGHTAYVRPGAKSALTTIAVAPTSSFDNWVRMAPNNQDLVVSRVTVTSPGPPPAGQSHLMMMSPAGQVTTLTTAALKDSIDGYELDHDNQWIAVLNVFGSQSHVIGVDHATGSVTTFATRPGISDGFNEMAIDRDPGAPAYALAWFTGSNAQSTKIFGATRQGILTTIAVTAGNSLRGLMAIELHPRSGDYLVTYPSAGPGQPVASRVTKGGVVTPINVRGLGIGNASRIGQDDLAWIVDGSPGQTLTSIAHYDFASNTVVATRTVTHPMGFCTGVEVYGSRPLTCNGSGKPGTTVSVSLRSQRPAAAGARYALAASLARRPGIQFPNGEWLDLAQDNLFFLSALNLAPTLFQNFQGTLNPLGAGKARVNIPAGLPANLGISVFVAGIIYGKQGIVQVTPSHWIVL